MAAKKNKTALITGVTGQDGAYLAKLLLEKNYRVVGAVRRASTLNLPRLAALGIDRDVELQTLDVQDLANIARMIETVQPDEIYNLSGQSSPQASFQQPLHTGETSGLGTLRLLEAIRLMKAPVRFYQASSSEVFGHAQGATQNEQTDFQPRSPYGVAKLYAHWMVINYREAYEMHASSGILFSHESPLRGMDFVTRKITDAIARIKLGSQVALELGNLNAKRDWGYAAEYVEGMWRMLQVDEPDTFVLATGITVTVRDFVRLACQAADIDVVFEGSGESEIGVDIATGKPIVRVNSAFYRPAEVELLVGDSGKAARVLNWRANATLESICRTMVEADLRRQGG